MRTSIATTRPSPTRPPRLAPRLVVAVFLVLVAVTPALAVSTSDLVQLAKAGLSDEVLIALVQADGTAFNLDAPRILELRAQGLSERVIVAMLRNGRDANGSTPVAAAAPAAPLPEEPPPMVIGGEPPAPEPVVQPQPVVVVPWVPAFGRPGHGQPHGAPKPTVAYRGFGRFINDGWVDRTAQGTTPDHR